MQFPAFLLGTKITKIILIIEENFRMKNYTTPYDCCSSELAIFLSVFASLNFNLIFWRKVKEKSDVFSVYRDYQICRRNSHSINKYVSSNMFGWLDECVRTFETKEIVIPKASRNITLPGKTTASE